MAIIEINYWAVLVVAILANVIGALWYSPLLFGKQWMKLSGITPKQTPKMKQKANVSYAINVVASLVMAYVLAHYVDFAEAVTIAGGLQAGFWAWLGFIAPVQLGKVLWENQPFKLYLLNTGYYFVSLLVMGAILAVWV